jgi:hypothetical protein
MGDERNGQPEIRRKSMLVRIKDLVFDIHKLDAIDFNNRNFVDGTIILFTNQTMHSVSPTIEEFNNLKEFFMSICPDLNTDKGRKDFLATIQQIAKLQGFNNAAKTQSTEKTDFAKEFIEKVKNNEFKQ